MPQVSPFPPKKKTLKVVPFFGGGAAGFGCVGGDGDVGVVDGEQGTGVGGCPNVTVGAAGCGRGGMVG